MADSLRTLVIKSEDHEYGLVTKKLGNGRFGIKLNISNKEVIGRICGKFRHRKTKKNNWIDIDSVVLVGLRDYQNNIVDIVHVYTPDEVRILKKEGEFFSDEKSRKDDIEQNIDIGFDFNSI